MNEYTNQNNEQEMQDPVNAAQNIAEPQNNGDTAQNATPQEQTVPPVQETPAVPQAQENIYAQTNANRNEAFAQSAEFHRETPYEQAAPGFNPYTGQPYGTESVNTKKAKKEKKAKKPLAQVMKKVAGVVAMALIFGVVSGAVIIGMTGKTPTQNDSGNGIITSDGIHSGANKVTGEIRSASVIMEEALKAAELTTSDVLTIPQINIIMQPTMVSINCYAEVTYNYPFFGSQVYPTQSAGSGIIVGENETELLIVTNNHVVDGADEIKVQLADEAEYTAYIKGTDAQNDLAVIVVRLEDITKESMDAIAYAELGDSDALVVGEGVVAIGNALGYGQSVTSGIVSALNRAVTDENGNTTYLIQTNAAINPGNFGGALVNHRGQVIGINSAKYSDEAVEGMCFAIPINTALPILEDLMSRVTRVEIADPDKQAYLGITTQDVTSTMAAAYNMPVGVYVSGVSEDSAADKAGMYAGDIITRFDKETVTSFSSLQKLLTYYEAGETVDIVVERYERGKYIETTLSVTLDVRPADTETGSTQNPTGDNNGGEEDDSVPSWKDFFDFDFDR